MFEGSPQHEEVHERVAASQRLRTTALEQRLQWKSKQVTPCTHNIHTENAQNFGMWQKHFHIAQKSCNWKKHYKSLLRWSKGLCGSLCRKYPWFPLPCPFIWFEMKDVRVDNEEASSHFHQDCPNLIHVLQASMSF